MFFLVAGHTKKDVDRLFNILKLLYQKRNIFCMAELCEACAESYLVTTHQVTYDIFLLWGDFLNKFYKASFKGILSYQYSSVQRRLAMGKFYVSLHVWMVQ